MQTIICYVAAPSAVGSVRNIDNSFGEAVPVLIAGVPVELKIRLFAGLRDATPYPIEQLAEVTGWSFELDSDYDGSTTCKIVADNGSIEAHNIEVGGKHYTEVSIPITRMYTEELAAALGTSPRVTLNGELVGYNSAGTSVFVVQINGFAVRNRISGLSTPTPIPPHSYELIVSGILTSGGYVTSATVGGLQGQLTAVSSSIEERPTSSNASQIAAEVISSGGHQISGDMTFSSNVVVSGALTVSAEAVATQPWVGSQLAAYPTSENTAAIVSGALISGGYVDSTYVSGAVSAASGGLQSQVTSLSGVLSGGLAERPTSSGAALIAAGEAGTLIARHDSSLSAHAELFNATAKAADTLPAAGSAYADQVYIYTGSTTSNFKHGRLYVCRSDGGGHVWRDVQTGLYPVGNVTGIRCYVLGTTATVKWSDPDDLVVDGVTLAAWGKTVLVRKQGGYPTGPDDGATVCVNTVRDAYKTGGFTETIPSGETYYYRWFIYTDDGVLNADPANEAVTGELTWATIREMCADATIDMRDVVSPGDVLTAANSVRPTDGNGNFEWQVTDVTEHDFGLCAYKSFANLLLDGRQKEYALTPDTVFATWKLLSFSGYNTANGNYFLKDETATGNARVWRRKTGTMEVRCSNGAWVVFNTVSETVEATQTTAASDPWDGVWSNGITVAKAKKYYTFDGTTYTEATVTDGDAIPSDTCYEYNPGGDGRVNYGSGAYENGFIDQLLNSDGDAGTFLVPPTIWSNLPSWASTQAGFKKGFDPDFLAAVKASDIVVSGDPAYGGGLKTLSRKFYLLSQTEVGFGGSEGSVLELYNGAENADRIKYQLNGNAVAWWLRTPGGVIIQVVTVNTSGAKDAGYPSYQFAVTGCVPACRIGMSE